MRLIFVLGVVGCGGSESKPVEAPISELPARIDAQRERPRDVVEGDTPMVCVLQTGKTINFGACFTTQLACDRFREANRDSSPCRELPGASCYNATITTVGQRRPVCFPTIVACEQVLDAERSSPDVSELSERCGIYRMRQR